MSKLGHNTWPADRFETQLLAHSRNYASLIYGRNFVGAEARRLTFGNVLANGTISFHNGAEADNEGQTMVYHGTVKSGVIELEGGAQLPDGTWVKVEPLELKADLVPKRPGTRLDEWAEQNAEDWGDQLNSENVEAFTGRRF